MPPRDSKPLDLDPSKMYFSTPEGPKPLGEVQAVEITEESELDMLGETHPRVVAQPSEFTGTITLTKEASEALRQFAATVETVERIIKQALEIVKEMCDNCPNRRVVHLAIRHGDPLVRKKNMKRVARYYTKRRKD